MRRRLAVATALLLVAGCGGEPSSRDDTFEATGYALAGSATAADVARDGEYLRTIGIDGVVLDGPDGITAVGAETTALREAAQEAGRDAVLLVSNYSDVIGDFDEDLANQMLTDPEARASVVAALVDAAADFDGVQIDLESLATRDSEGLVDFTRELRDALPDDDSVSMAFTASTDVGGYRERGYDLEALDPHLDRLVLMAYDQHGPWSDPGPIADLAWVRSELDYVASVIDPEKIDLGVATYGYQWGTEPDTLTVAEAREAAGDAARWDASAGEWTADLSGGRTLWWSDARSLAVREKIARAAGLHGVAIWQIGASGPLH